ncbi:MAG: Ca-activated chloride channel, partial [Pseudonocardiales bacterium]|nr:Ca-activated chloride channel [Pseudonocardiales bacterium]
GQVGNEDQLLRDIAPVINRTRVHAVGIDTAVNAGFLGRLAAAGAGRCELVESEDRLDEAMTHIQRRIGAPIITDVMVSPESSLPKQPTAIYPGVPLVVFGRYTGMPEAFTVRGRTRDGAEWHQTVAVLEQSEPAVRAQWARAALRDLEDRYATGDRAVEDQIVRTSLRYGVLCRFTAFVAVDEKVVSDGTVHRVVQPVELPSGWQPQQFSLQAGGYGGPPAPMATFAAAPSAFPPPAPQVFAGPPRARAAAPKMMVPGGGGGGGAPAPDNPAELREIAATEVRRLEKDAALPAWERRDLLADLASRLGTLLAAKQGPVYEPLRQLVAELNAGGDVDKLWARAREVLQEFAGAGKERRRKFWR